MTLSMIPARSDEHFVGQIANNLRIGAPCRRVCGTAKSQAEHDKGDSVKDQNLFSGRLGAVMHPPIGIREIKFGNQDGFGWIGKAQGHHEMKNALETVAVDKGREG